MTTLNSTIQKAACESKPLHAVVGATDLAAQRIREVGAGLTERLSSVDVKSAPAEMVSAASSAYDDLAGRGKTVLDRVREDEAVAETTRQARTTASKAKGTATTAKKSAASTKSQAKATSTSAKKTAGSAAKATRSATSPRSTSSSRSTSGKSGSTTRR